MTFRYKKIDHPEYKYELLESFDTYLDFTPDTTLCARCFLFTTLGLLEVYKGYRWDGASGPTIDTESTMAASCVHDVLYQMIREGLLPYSYKIKADKELRRLMIKADSSWWGRIRASYYYAAVRCFGFRACQPKR